MASATQRLRDEQRNYRATLAVVGSAATVTAEAERNFGDIMRARSHADWLANAKRAGESHPFLVSCRLAGIEPGLREVARWRDGRGVALEAAWAKWPKSKNLPKLRRTPKRSDEE